MAFSIGLFWPNNMISILSGFLTVDHLIKKKRNFTEEEFSNKKLLARYKELLRMEMSIRLSIRREGPSTSEKMRGKTLRNFLN